MRILIADKEYVPQKYEDYPKALSYALTDRGHQVDLATTVVGVDLSRYDVVVAHPTADDIMILDEELAKEREIRIIIISGDYEMAMDCFGKKGKDKVVYSRMISNKDIGSIVEKQRDLKDECL